LTIILVKYVCPRKSALSGNAAQKKLELPDFKLTNFSVIAVEQVSFIYDIKYYFKS
ncbi:hypothetical protein WUBG_18798, partial [Wuchereria bancrofti]